MYKIQCLLMTTKNGQYITQLARRSIDPKFVELTADVVKII